MASHLTWVLICQWKFSDLGYFWPWLLLFQGTSSWEGFCPSAPESAELQGEGLSFEALCVLFLNAWQARGKIQEMQGRIPMSVYQVTAKGSQ